MKEIVSVQVGGFANFVGSHFWNFQDELLGLAADPYSDPVFSHQCLDMDVLYRHGQSQQGTPTYTPRLLSIDLPGSLGSMASSLGTLCTHTSTAIPSNLPTWTGSVSTHISQPHHRNLFLQRLYQEEQEQLGASIQSDAIHKSKDNTSREISDKEIVHSLENDIKFWTDFSKVHYHQKSLYELSGLWTGIQDFDNYGTGKDAFTESFRGEEISERLRYFVEECDHIQGFQFIVDDSGGFSAVAADFLEYIADEYTNTPVLLYTVRSPSSYVSLQSQKQAVVRNLHDALSFARLSSLCKLIVPVGSPFLSKSKASTFLSIKDEKLYHSSAVYAAALHSISLPCRMQPLGPTADTAHFSGAADVNDVIQMLTGLARQNMVAILDVAIPAPSLSGKKFELPLSERLQPLTPDIAEDAEDLHATELMTIQGAFQSGGRQALISEVKDAVNDDLEYTTRRPKFCHLSIAQCPVPIPLPYPSIFGSLVGQHGELLSSPNLGSASRGSLDVHSIPVASRLRSSSAILPYLENRLGSIRKYGIQRGAPCSKLLQNWGFEEDELADIVETLSKMVVACNDPYLEVTSDSD